MKIKICASSPHSKAAEKSKVLKLIKEDTIGIKMAIDSLQKSSIILMERYGYTAEQVKEIIDNL